MISPSVPGHGRQRDVERPRARPDAEDADPVLGRRGHRHAVAVPCESVTGVPGSVAIVTDRPVHSGWVRSAAASTSAISGLSGVTGGGVSAGSATFARQSLGGPGERVAGTAWSVAAAARWPARRRAVRACAARPRRRARRGARPRSRPSADVARAEALGDRRRRPCRARRRRSRCQDPHAPTRRSRRRAAASADPAAAAAGALISRAARAAAKARVTGEGNTRGAAIGAAPPHEPTLAGWTSSPSSRVA